VFVCKREGVRVCVMGEVFSCLLAYIFLMVLLSVVVCVCVCVVVVMCGVMGGGESVCERVCVCARCPPQQ